MVQSLIRAMGILEQLRFADKSCSLAELAQNTDLPPSTVHRILQTFVSSNYVTWDEKTHLYHLGPGLIPLGMVSAKQLHLRDAAIPVLNDLVQATGEDAFLMIVSGYKGLVLEKVEGPNHIKVIDSMSFEWDLNCGGIRKSLLAFQSDSFIQSFIEHGLKKVTKNTIVEDTKLLDQIKKIREDGVACSRGEYILDAVGVGAPVFDKDGKAIASIGVIAPESRTSDEKEEAFKNLVKQYAKKLSILLGNVYNK